jgi:hypothetical protein
MCMPHLRLPVPNPIVRFGCGREARARAAHEDAVTVEIGLEDIGDVHVWVRRHHQLGLVDTVHRITQQRRVHLEPKPILCTLTPHHRSRFRLASQRAGQRAAA